jgi:hypothetical protein
MAARLFADSAPRRLPNTQDPLERHLRKPFDVSNDVRR